MCFTPRSFIPISLLTSFQFVKYFQGYFLEKNPLFKSEQYSLKCQTSQLNEDLGLVEYVFSDKTGTLTKNNMVFKSLYVGGKRYGSIVAEQPADPAYRGEHPQRTQKARLPVELGGQFPESSEDEEAALSSRRLSSDGQTKPPRESVLKPSSQRQVLDAESGKSSTGRPGNQNTAVIPAVRSALQAGAITNKLFFTILTCCHEVSVKKDSSSGEKVLNASSPDEVALLQFAAHVGFDIEGFDERSMEILVREIPADQLLGQPDTDNKPETTSTNSELNLKRYKLLAQFRFTSERSRMSVVVRDTQSEKNYLLTKGADHVMIERGGSYEGFSKEDLREVLGQYSSQGLRTLVYGFKELSDQEVEALIKEIKAIEQKVGKEKELKMQELAHAIEQQLKIIGASAVEDELQDDVRDTLRSLRNAGIKVWMLTGDKFETAVNIGYSSGLLKPDDKLIELKPEEEAIKEEELRRFFKELELSVG